MKLDENINLLKSVKLFNGIDEKNIISLMPCLNYRVKEYEKNSTIFSVDDIIDNIGIVISGSCEIIKENAAGNRVIVSVLESGDMFAEAIVCRENKKSPVNVVTIENSKILFISYDKIIRTCQSRCEFHVSIINNLLMIIAEKNFILNNKIDILLLKGMREKIATFLLRKYKQTGQSSFNIGLNRNQLADYLNVCRSALSRELSRMKDEGILDYYKDTFKINDVESLKKIIL